MSHGSNLKEQPTRMPQPVQTAGVTLVAFGTAPVNLVEDVKNVNVPIVIKSFDEFEKTFGYSDDFEKYTLCEVADAAFNLFQVGPVVFVNMLDPNQHKTTIAPQALTIENNKATIEQQGIIASTLKLIADSTTLVKGTDYLTTFDGNGYLSIVFLTAQTNVTAEYDIIDASKVTNADIIGGYDVNDMATGLELLNKVYARTKYIPGLVIVPKFSTEPAVAAVMRAKVQNINEYFKSFTLTDIDSSVVTKYSDVANYKNENNYTGKFEAVCWPKVARGSKVYHLSTQFACSILRLCQVNNDFPYESASNKTLEIDRIVVKKNGKYEELDLEVSQANLLNEQGIVTAINFVNGLTLWGNNTAAFPVEKDVKDMFHAVRIMHNYVGNTIILTTWAEVDGPISKKKLDSIVDKMNIWFNGLQGTGAIVGGRVVALNEDNPEAQLLAGRVVLRYYVAEQTPMQQIDNILEFDANYYSNLFS